MVRGVIKTFQDMLILTFLSQTDCARQVKEKLSVEGGKKNVKFAHFNSHF